MKTRSRIPSRSKPGPQPSTTLQVPEAVREFLACLPAVLYKCGPAPDYPTVFVSDNVECHFGYKPQEFYADPFFWTKRIHDQDKARVLGKLAAMGREDFLTYEYRFRRSDGRYVWLHDQVSVLRGSDSRIVGLVGSWFDIDDRKRLEMLQVCQAQVLDSLVQRRSLGETLERIVRMIEEQNADTIASVLRFDSATQTLHHGAAPSLPPEYNRAIDGVKIGPVAGSCGTAAFRRERVVVTDIQKDPLWADYRKLAANCGVRACWSQPIISSSGQLLGTFAMYYRTPRGPSEGELELIEQAASMAALAIERYQDEEMMRHTERLASLGTVVAGIAHEINNPLAGIQLAAERAAAALDKGKVDRVRSMLESIAGDTQRCARIVRGVLQFGRRDRGSEQALSLTQILTAACELAKGYAAERRASVEFTPPAEDVDVLARLVELEQVFVNILHNAIESKDRGAKVKIEVALDRDCARVMVTDDGRGMTAEQKSRVFDPFFTTRHAEGGTGLGLSIAHGIVAAHGGAIHVDSKPQKGTTVVVCLPRRG